MSAPFRSALVLALTLGIGTAALAQDKLPSGPVQPRPGEGWTKDDVYKDRNRPVPNLDRINATVVKFAVSTGGRFIVTLDNGTRWTQIEDRNIARVAVGDDVVLHKSTIGSYMLTTEDGISTRVERNR